MTDSLAATSRNNVAFIFDSLADWTSLAAAAEAAGSEVIVLDGSTDGLRQMVDHLSGRSNLRAIQVFSHGSAGRVELGSLWLDEAAVSARVD